jgi:[ribosomal protein S5]-alanine N-acetyltransferase
VPLELSRCTLRPWRIGDEASLVRYADNRNVWRNMRDRFPHPYTAADAEAWIKKASAETPATSFAIVVDGAAVGGVGIELGTDVFRRSAEIGYWVGEPFWGRGIATEALGAMTEYAFAHFDICRLVAGVFEWNPASARVLEKVGYTLEGRARRGVVKDGRTGDRLLYALVRP